MQGRLSPLKGRIDPVSKSLAARALAGRSRGVVRVRKSLA